MVNQITKESLISRGWEVKEDKILSENYYAKWYGEFHLILRENMSNMANRNWMLHVDNDHFETVASADVETYKHIDMVMEMLNDSFMEDTVLQYIESEANTRYWDDDDDYQLYNGFCEGAKWMYDEVKSGRLS